MKVFLIWPTLYILTKFNSRRCLALIDWFAKLNGDGLLHNVELVNNTTQLTMKDNEEVGDDYSRATVCIGKLVGVISEQNNLVTCRFACSVWLKCYNNKNVQLIGNN